MHRFAILLFVPACTIDAPDLTGATAPIAAEIPGRVEGIPTQYGSPEVAATSFAAPIYQGGLVCAATMIGPNLLLTAAHCGPRDAEAIGFQTYRGVSLTNFAWEVFTCRRLAQTWPDTDLALSYCAPNELGEHPGDKYGWVDIDPSPTWAGQSAYSVWWNPITSRSIDVAALYSPGLLYPGSFPGHWAEPDAIPGSGMLSTIYGEPGCSGSALFDTKNHRIVTAPTSTVGGGLRGLVGMDALLRGGFIGAGVSDLNEPLLAELGVPPRRGPLDADADGRLDLQTDIERKIGERTRPWTFLGFDSPRRAALFSPGASASMWPFVAWATLSGPARLDHLRLALGPGRYRVAFRARRWDGLAATSSLRIVDAAGLLAVSVPISTAIGVDTAFAKTFTLASQIGSLTVEAGPGAKLDVRDLILIADGGTLDFDSEGARFAAFDESGRRQLVLPEGFTSDPLSKLRSPEGPDFAGIVRRDLAAPSAFTFAVARAGLAGGERTRVCFRHRRLASAAPVGDYAVARMVLDGTELGRVRFAPTTGWGAACLPTVTPARAGAVLAWGIDAATPLVRSPWNAQDGTYVIDDVTFH